MNLVSLLYSIATGPRRARLLMTPVGLAGFFLLMTAVVYAGLSTDRALGLTPLIPRPAAYAAGFALLSAGLVLCLWCVVRFSVARGTPVPFNPPHELVTKGPYAWSRNPMVTGVFAVMLGLGLVLQSLSLVFVWVPLLIVACVIELKLIEEPELEMRFGARYVEYKHDVPMFIPGIRRFR